MPTLVDRPVVVEDSALVSVLSEYVRRRESHPVVFDVRTGRFRLPPATPAEQAQIIAAELAWYELWVRDVVDWMRSRIE